MTNDYKDKLLKYVTGNLDKEQKSQIPYYANTSVEQTSSAPFVGSQLKCLDSNGNYNGKVIYYGYNMYGENFIDLCDENGNLLKHLTTFSSGTPFWSILNLNVDETGNVYGVFANVQGGGIVNSRFILMNNISEKTLNGDYEAILRASYFIQTNISYENMYQTSCVSLIKSKQSSSYFMLWYYTGNSTIGQEKIFGIRFNIVVGGENEWIDYTPINIGMSFLNFIDYSEFDINDNVKVTTYLLKNNNNDLDIYKLINNDTSFSYSNYCTLPGQGNIFPVSLRVTKNKFYLLSLTDSNANNQVTTIVKIYIVENGTYQVVLENSSIVSGEPIINLMENFMDEINGLPFYCYYLPYGDTEHYKLYYGVIPNNSDVDISFVVSNVITYSRAFFVNSTFNIINIIVQYSIGSDDYKEITKIIFNSDNYNGENYENKNSLLPKQGILFDENNNLIFARNLYNYKVYNNRSISVLNIPNTYLNGVEIGNQKLLSDTNTTIIDDMEPINKNIYEDLYINFNNQLIMQNQNDTNYVDNLEGAIRLNQSTGSVLDYDNAKANKIRVTYDDDTSYITMANNEINNDICTYTIGVHVPSNKNILKIDIISNDENTIYQSITNLNLANNKYYVITQDVHVV